MLSQGSCAYRFLTMYCSTHVVAPVPEMCQHGILRRNRFTRPRPNGAGDAPLLAQILFYDRLTCRPLRKSLQSDDVCRAASDCIGPWSTPTTCAQSLQSVSWKGSA